MTAYEMMLSESQERMLMVLKPGKEAFAEAIFHKWELDFAVIGEVTDTGRMVLVHKGETVCDIPIAPLADDAPLYDRPHVPTPSARRSPIFPPALDMARGPREADGQPRHCLAPLDLGTV
jgi:phosphoribosylformylglycinamidine (FGAM) synthase-like enzyme